MRIASLLAGISLSTALLAGGRAAAAELNEGPPPGIVILDLDGQATFGGAYHHYTVDFTAPGASTDLTFALRYDASFLFLDNVSMTTGGGANLLTNGGFESDATGANPPTGWTYANPLDVLVGGHVSSSLPFAGSRDFADGATGAYDTLTQTVSTTPGDTYHLSFWLYVFSAPPTFQRLSTVSASGAPQGAVDLVVYANDASGAAGAIPEPGTWAMMLIGFGGLGALLRRRRKVASLQLV